MPGVIPDGEWQPLIGFEPFPSALGESRGCWDCPYFLPERGGVFCPISTAGGRRSCYMQRSVAIACLYATCRRTGLYQCLHDPHGWVLRTRRIQGRLPRVPIFPPRIFRMSLR
eukprot:scaffold547798_cov71-Attheya_sp.AAC.1